MEIIENPVTKEAIEALKNTNFKTLARLEELGKDFNFKEATGVLETIQQDLIRVSEDASFLRTPKSTEKKIEEIATRAKDFILQINNFAVRGNPQAEEQHKQIHQNIEKLKEDALGVLPPLIERAEIKKLDPAAIQTQIAQATKSIQEINAIKKEAEKLKDDTALAIKEVRDALGKEGVLISSKDFEMQADHHRNLARYWFWGAVATIIISVLLIITLFSGKFLFWKLPNLPLSDIPKDNYPLLAQVVIFKLVLLSIAYLLIHQSIKNFKVNQHLDVLNRHRQLVLTVYPLMIKGTSDAEQSNTILGQAAKSIFDPGTSGYLDGEDNPNPINLTEIINKFADQSIK